MKVNVLARFLSIASFCLIIAPLIVITQCDDNDPIAPVVHECGSGNVNLNDHPYEIADAFIFTDYLIYGNPAFAIDTAEQARATDVNCNGKSCEVADLVHLIRIIVGDPSSTPQTIPTDTADFTYYNGLIETDAQLGAALLIFDGEVDINSAGDFEVMFDVVDGNTRALIYAFQRDEAISGYILYTSEAPISIEAANYYGTPFISSIVGPRISFSNYPNPFYATTKFSLDIPEQCEFSITIRDLLGNQVDRIESEGVGRISIVWDAGDLPDGAYIATVEAYDTEDSIILFVLRPE